MIVREMWPNCYEYRRNTEEAVSESVLAIDPGRAKCGVAVVGQDGRVLWRGIVTPESLIEQTRALIAAHGPRLVVCGNGTGSKAILKALQAADLPVPVEAMDEAHTSEAARARFVRENRPPLLLRLLPCSLRTPWLPYDDYVAVILAERYWQANCCLLLVVCCLLLVV